MPTERRHCPDYRRARFAPSLPVRSLVVGEADGVVQRVLQLDGGHAAAVVGGGVHVAQDVVAEVAGYAGGGLGDGVQRQLAPGQRGLDGRRAGGLGVSPPTATRAAVQRGAWSCPCPWSWS